MPLRSLVSRPIRLWLWTQSREIKEPFLSAQTRFYSVDQQPIERSVRYKSSCVVVYFFFFNAAKADWRVQRCTGKMRFDSMQLKKIYEPKMFFRSVKRIFMCLLRSLLILCAFSWQRNSKSRDRLDESKSTQVMTFTSFSFFAVVFGCHSSIYLPHTSSSIFWTSQS